METAIRDSDASPAVGEKQAALVRSYRDATGAVIDVAAAELRLAASTSVLLLALRVVFVSGMTLAMITPQCRRGESAGEKRPLEEHLRFAPRLCAVARLSTDPGTRELA